MATPHRVVILGGGFAGVRVAQRLASSHTRRKFSVTLISREAVQTYTPGLYQLAGAVTDATRRKAMDRALSLPHRRILAGLPVTLMQAEIMAIDTEAKVISLNDSRVVLYDTLVIALGSESATYGIPGMSEHAIMLKSLKDADRVNRTIANMMRGRATPIRITVGGGGATGTELSAMLAEKIGAWQAGVHITLIEAAPNILCGFPLKTSVYAKQQLEKRGVNVITAMAIKEAKDRAVVLADGTEIPHDIFIWNGGTQAPTLLKTLPFVLDGGRLAVDAPLTCVPVKGGVQTHVYAIGDATCFHFAGSHAPWTAQVALQQADHAAKNILRTLSGLPIKPFHLPYQSYVIPLGATGGVAEALHIPVKGRLVQLLTYLVEAHHLLSMLSLRDTWRIIRMRLRTL